ncbi:MAG: ABC transporter ATP-binding protein [Geminicoccaceae bacterium]
MASIKLQGVRKDYGVQTVVKDLDLAVEDKEFLVLLGPSGCGKTTTMRMVAGLVEPSAGTIEIGGRTMAEVEPRDRDVAMVFQSYALYPNMTVYENIRFPLRMRGEPWANHDRLVREAAAMVELGDYLNRRPKFLSGGQRQRAALARAIVRRPQAFLMDEPLSNLDAKLRISMRAQLKHVQRELKITTIYVTHDQVEAMTLADRTVIMDGGRIQQLGTPDEIYNDPANTFVAGFIGAPPMNLIDGELQDGTFTGSQTKVPGLAPDRSGSATLGVRSEDASVSSPDDAHLKGTLYALEPMGDMTLLAVDIGGSLVSVRADRAFRQPLDTPIGVRFDTERVYLFDGKTGNRLRF